MSESVHDEILPECSQVMEFNVLGRTVFTEEGYYSLGVEPRTPLA